MKIRWGVKKDLNSRELSMLLAMDKLGATTVNPVRIGEIAAELNIGFYTVFTIVRQLESKRLVSKDDDKIYLREKNL